jgi:hypothetical protein
MYLRNKYSERVEHVKYWVTSLSNENSLHEKINCTLQSGDCLLLFGAESFLSSIFLSKNIKVKVCGTIILDFVLCGCETWTTAVSEEHMPRVLQKCCAEEDIWACEW